MNGIDEEKCRDEGEASAAVFRAKPEARRRAFSNTPMPASDLLHMRFAEQPCRVKTVRMQDEHHEDADTSL